MQVLIYSAYYKGHEKLYSDIFQLTRPVEGIYPNYRYWYYKTFLEDLKRGNRAYAVAMHHMKLCGCCLMKNTPDEKKICTLFVDPDFRRQGIGTRLVQASFKELGPYPFLTTSLSQVNSFTPFIGRLGFQAKPFPKKDLAMPTEVLFYRPVPQLIHRAVMPLPAAIQDKTHLIS